MTYTDILSSVKHGFAHARTTFDLVTSHGVQVLHTGVQTLEAARSVVVGAGSDTAAVLARAREDLKKTFADGAAQVGQQLVRIATPTRKEEAALRKAEVRQKKTAKQEEAQARQEQDAEGAAADADAVPEA